MANIDFYAFGVPDGYSSIKGKESHTRYLELFYGNLEGKYGREMVVKKRKDGATFYSLLVYPDKGKNFIDNNGRPGSFFGLSLVLTNQQFKDPKKVYTFLNNVYDHAIKGNIIEDTPLSKKYKIRDLSSPQIEKFVAAAIQKEFSNGLLNGEIIDFNYNDKDPTNYQLFTAMQPTPLQQKHLSR